MIFVPCSYLVAIKTCLVRRALRAKAEADDLRSALQLLQQETSTDQNQLELERGKNTQLAARPQRGVFPEPPAARGNRAGVVLKILFCSCTATTEDFFPETPPAKGESCGRCSKKKNALLDLYGVN